MSRFFAFAVSTLGVGLALALAVAFGCSSSGIDAGDATDAGATRRDSAIVDPTEGGPALDAGPTVAASCERYCNLVTTNCTAANAQYASFTDCLAFCGHLPLDQSVPDTTEKAAATVSCRQYWADSPARTDPTTFCLSAGPFGGNVCGDRCTAFCDVVLDACSGGDPGPYSTRPECASACANFSYRDAGTDGGGEGPFGPDAGDTLNCRLYYLRAAANDGTGCAALRPDSGPCGAP